MSGPETVGCRAGDGRIARLPFGGGQCFSQLLHTPQGFIELAEADMVTGAVEFYCQFVALEQ